MDDKYLWLEEVNSERALTWARELSQETIDKIKTHPSFFKIEEDALNSMDAKEKIPYVSIVGDFLYNTWFDSDHLQGIFRRTTINEYLTENPSWETILDIDQLSSVENTTWVLQEFNFNRDKTRAMVVLSPGGSDANVAREFDLETKSFIIDGFILPLSKGSVHWMDDNTLRLCREFDENSLSASAYPITVRDWKRGQKIEEATTVFKGAPSDVLVYSREFEHEGGHSVFLERWIDFQSAEIYFDDNGHLIKLNLPAKCFAIGVFKNNYIVTIKEDWQGNKSGDILAYNLKTHVTKKLLSPGKNQSIDQIYVTKNGLIAIIDEDVKGALYFCNIHDDLSLKSKKIDLPSNGTVDHLCATPRSDKFFVSYSSFNSPSIYFYGEGENSVRIAKKTPSLFNHQEIEVSQYFAKSLDGTMIPYFVAYKKGTRFNGTNPTILYGYGGFEISLKPTFSNILGSAWLDRGGIYVLSHIRGGGEYGPSWHQAAMKEKRHKAYEDFFAIAEDLFFRKITSPKHLGALGGSNGGLLMGVAFTQRPDLFKAICCEMPLLDMHRYHKLPPGPSWIAEYGDPDDDKDGAFIRSISPYQNIKKEGQYPIIFLTTSTKDDRAHPGHARKFAARLLEYGHAFEYFENFEGGHAAATNNKQYAFFFALEFSFFWKHLSS